MKIGILGGSFDPPHFGHLSISKQVRAILGLDEIWLMPCYQHPFAKNLSPVEHRLAMTKFLEQGSIKVSEYEITQNRKSFTIDTLNGLTRKFPENIFYWIIGSDQIRSLNKYKDWKEIISKYNLVIFPRGSVASEIEVKIKRDFNLQSIPKNVIVIKSERLALSNISSTDVRKGAMNSESIRDMVPREVEEYIKKHGLYRSNIKDQISKIRVKD